MEGWINFDRFMKKRIGSYKKEWRVFLYEIMSDVLNIRGGGSGEKWVVYN